MKKEKLTEEEQIARIKSSRKRFIRKMNLLFRSEYRYSKKFNNDHMAEDGKAYINVDLTKVEEGPFSIYSYGRRIDPEIFNYIDQEAFFLRADVPVVVTFDDGNRYSKELKDKIKAAVIRHYALEYEEKRKDYDRNNWIGLISLGLGLVVLIAYIILSIVFSKRDFNTIYIEVLLIMSWMLIWSSLDRLLFKRSELQVESFNAGQLALMEVRFPSDKEGATIVLREEKKEENQ